MGRKSNTIWAVIAMYVVMGLSIALCLAALMIVGSFL